MPVSPHDFSLWARATGNNYPNSVEEKARLAPEVHNFARNYAKPGAIGAQEPEEEGEIEQKQSNLGSNLAKAALVAGGVAATVAAARDPRVQRGFQVAKESVINTSDRVKDFLQTVGQPSTVDMDVVNASGDVTPNPRQQQAAAGPEITTTGVTSPVTREVPGFDQDGEYIHPSRIPGMEGGDYRGRNLDTEATSATLRQGRKDNEAGLFNRYQETGEIPASQLSPEQKAALRIPEEDVNNIINEAKGQIKNDQLLDQKATQGTLTRAEEGAWLQNELNRSGTTPQQLFGHDSIEAYMDTYMPKERVEASPKSIYVTETDEKDIGPQHFMPGTNMSWDDVHFNAGIGKYADPVNDLASARAAVNNELIAAGMLKEGGTLQPGQSLTPEQKSVLNPDTLTNLKAAHQASQNLAQVEASGEPGVSGGSGGTGQKSLSDQADEFLGRVQGPMPPYISEEEAVSMQSERSSLRNQARNKFILENREAIERGEIDPLSEQHRFNQPSLSDVYPNPWAEDHEEIVRDQVSDKGATVYKNRDPVSGYSYADIQEKLNEGKVDPAREEIDEILLRGRDARQSPIRARIESFVGETETPKADVTYSLPEAVENDRTNSLFASSITPDNQVPKVDKDLSGTSLTSQHDIEMEADNIIDIARTRLDQKRAQITESTGMPAHRVDEFLGKYFPSIQQGVTSEIEADLAAHTAINPEDASTVARAYYDPDKGGVLREGSSDDNEGMTVVRRNPFRERALPNYGPDAQVTKPATTSSIRGGGRRLDSEESITRERDLGGDEMGPDIRGGIVGPSGSLYQTEGETKPLGVQATNRRTGITSEVERAPRQQARRIVPSGLEPIDKAAKKLANPGGMGVYGQETGFVPGAMSSKTGEYSNEAIGARYVKGEGMYDPGATYTDAQGRVRYLRNQPGAEQPRRPSEPLFAERTEKDPFKGVPNEILQGHLERAKPGTPTHQNLSSELYRRSGQEIGIIREPGESKGPTALEFLTKRRGQVQVQPRAEVDVWTPDQVSRQPQVREINVTREPSQGRNLQQEYIAQDPGMKGIRTSSTSKIDPETGRPIPTSRKDVDDQIARIKQSQARRNLYGY